MSEEEIIDKINLYLRYADVFFEMPGRENVVKTIKSLLDLHNKEKEKNEKLEKIIRIIRNKLKYKVIIEEDGFYKPCKNLSKQEVYKDYEEIIDLLKADYCFMDNETAIKEILKEMGLKYE